MSRRVIVADHVRQAARQGRVLRLVKGRCLLTDEARDLAARLKVKVEWGEEARLPASSAGPEIRGESGRVQVALGADHGGWPLKEVLKRRLEDGGWTLLDLGCHGREAVDYPDYARAVAEAVAGGQAARGLMIDSVGVASAMVANRVPGIRAAACESLASALSSRRHNDANLLCLGGTLLSGDAACNLVLTWLQEPYEGGRHQRRLDKLSALDRR
jgi:ribose 5-phosphate isomerase B